MFDFFVIYAIYETLEVFLPFVWRVVGFCFDYV